MGRELSNVEMRKEQNVLAEGRSAREPTVREDRLGAPQGSPLSPMLSNIVLNELDQELERRGLHYARWADDFVALVRNRHAAERVRNMIHRYNLKSTQQIVEDLNQDLRGWGDYFKVRENRSVFDSLDHWVRQRLRSMPNSEVKETDAIRRRR